MARNSVAARAERPRAQLPRLTPLASALTLLLSAPVPVLAQDAPIEEITITGSRIQRTSGFTTPVPVTAVTPEELRSFKPGTTIADQLDLLPQFYQTLSAQRGGGVLFGTAGGSYLDMRAMGPQRTLILLDGARITPADRNGYVHVDNIPAALLQSVEVVTGGASAAYGADALAGVTNFRLNRTFTGLEFSASVGQTDFGDGDNYQWSVAGGTTLGDRWHFIGSIENQRIDQIYRNPQELGGWFRRYGYVQNPAWSGPGDTSVPRNLVLPDVHSRVHTPTGKIQAPGFSLDGYTFTYDGSGVRPFEPGNVVGPDTQSGGPEADIANAAFDGLPFGAEVRRDNVFAGFTFDATDRLRFFANAFAGKTESNQHNFRNIPHLTSPWHVTIYRENAFLPADLRQAMFDEGVESFILQKQGSVWGQSGNYNDDEKRLSEFKTWTLQLGIDQQLFDSGNWRLQARLQRGATDKDTAIPNALRVDREFLAIDAVSVDPETGEVLGDAPGEDPSLGAIICNVQRFNPTPQELAEAVDGFLVPAPQGDDSLGGPTDLVPIPGPVGPDAIPNCVPMNVFGQGNVSPAAAAYVVSPKYGVSAVTQEFAEVLLTGNFWDGYGPGPFSMAAGATYRKQWFWQRGLPVDLMAYGPPRNAEDLGIRGISAGFTGGSANLHEFSTVPAIGGGYDVWETFAEFNLPLWESGPRRFELDLAGRYSNYSTSGGIISHKTGLNFTATESLRLRATASRDVREPTFSERFDLQGGGGRVNDPRYGNDPVEITITSGGNPDLVPEEADTITAGLVYQPTRVPGLQFSVDWYEIDLHKAVGLLGATPGLAAQTIVNNCEQGVVELCALVFRDPATDVITGVRAVQQNIDRAKVRGIDYEVLFTSEPNLFSNLGESLSVRVLAGRMLEDSITSTSASGGTVTTDTAGQYTQPDFSLLATVRYRVGGLGVSLQQRYIPESTRNVNWVQWEPGIVLPSPTAITVDDNTVQSKSYTDMTFSWNGELGNGRSWRLALAITNLFDVDPPIIPEFGQRFSSQSLPAGAYDIYGRRYLMNFDYRF